MSGKTTIDGIDVVEDGNVTRFTVSEELKREDERRRLERLEREARKPKSWLERIVAWFKSSSVTPYAKVRDLADPLGDRRSDWTDADAGDDGKFSAEVGIKVRF